jgi:hypothetical protein
MMYKLRNGHRVITRKVDSEATEFQTINPTGETISTVTLGREESRELVIGLRTAVALNRG